MIVSCAETEMLLNLLLWQPYWKPSWISKNPQGCQSGIIQISVAHAPELPKIAKHFVYPYFEVRSKIDVWLLDYMINCYGLDKSIEYNEDKMTYGDLVSCCLR